MTMGVAGGIDVMEYLPIGSVVKLIGSSKRLMVAGILQMEQGNEEAVHDYMGLPYPEGYLGQGMMFLFDEPDVDEVVFRGYEDEERTRFMSMASQVFDAMGTAGSKKDEVLDLR